MNINDLHNIPRPVCPGDQVPLETLLPALRDVVLMRTKARREVEAAIQAVQNYGSTVMESEFIRSRNSELAKFVPPPIEQEDIDYYVRALRLAKISCYSIEILHNLLPYRIELQDIIRVSKGIKETFNNLISLIKVSQKVSSRQYAVQRRLRHPWSFINYVRETPPPTPVSPPSDELDWEQSEPTTDFQKVVVHYGVRPAHPHQPGNSTPDP
jgi:hypothetical protein